MLNDREKTGCRKFLQGFQSHELLSLVETVTNRMITVQSKKDAISAIIQHSDTAEELLRRRKVKKEYIFRHLNAERVSASPTADKETLVQQLLSHWGTPEPPPVVASPQAPISKNVVKNRDRPVSLASPFGARQDLDSHQPVHVQTLAVQFTTWFFQQLNSLGSESPQDWGPQHFWGDAKLCLCLASAASPGESRQEAFEGAELAAQRLQALVREEGLLFNPNVSPDGVQSENNAHGLVRVSACGTLHRGANCLGLFEQQVGLIRDPLRQNIWKIKFIHLNLKEATVQKMPTLMAPT